MTPSADQNRGTGEASLIRPRVDFSSKNLERTQEFLFNNNIQLNVACRDARNLSARVTGIYLTDSMDVGSAEYGARASVLVTPQRVHTGC
jgi:hypothetical protein